MRWTLANIVTLLRVLLVPFTLVCLQMGGTTWLAVALVLMGVSEASDYLDGQIARRMQEVTKVGKLLDPMSDALYRASVFVSFLASGWMPLWMTLVFIWRDLIVAYLRSYAATHGIVLGARQSGKIKAVVQAIAQIGTVVLYWHVAWKPDELFMGFVMPQELSFVFLSIAAAVTAWSAVDYTVGTFRSAAAVRRGDAAD